ncbi:nucleoside diphosphate-linked moiety X motif 17 isoform X2 [Strix uralensis]|uniref:nucleoside diphosphate-linked moiety X motif 17 isoform X2 n=1 Tax=Strix uralensis TaxID=36305 RepID=UPI003DA79FD9
MAGLRRVLVHVRRGGAERPARVGQSVTGTFCPAHEDVAVVSCGLDRGRFLLSDVAFPGSTVALLERPSSCPAKHLGEPPAAGLPAELRGRGVAVAVAVLLQASTGHILLTRRAGALSTFPNVWVPPVHLPAGAEPGAAASPPRHRLPAAALGRGPPPAGGECGAAVRWVLVHPRGSWCIPVGPGASRCTSVCPGASPCVLVHPGTSVCPGASPCVLVHPSAPLCVLVHPRAPLCVLVHPRGSWCIPVHLCVSWCILVCSGASPCVLVRPGASRCTSVCPGASPCVLVCPGAYQCTSVCPGASWCVLVHPHGSWCVLVHPSVSQCVLVHPGASPAERCHVAQARLRPSASEVSACAWLEPSVLEAIAGTAEEAEEGGHVATTVGPRGYDTRTRKSSKQNPPCRSPGPTRPLNWGEGAVKKGASKKPQKNPPKKGRIATCDPCPQARGDERGLAAGRAWGGGYRLNYTFKYINNLGKGREVGPGDNATFI